MKDFKVGDKVTCGLDLRIYKVVDLFQYETGYNMGIPMAKVITILNDDQTFPCPKRTKPLTRAISMLDHANIKDIRKDMKRRMKAYENILG